MHSNRISGNFSGAHASPIGTPTDRRPQGKAGTMHPQQQRQHQSPWRILRHFVGRGGTSRSGSEQGARRGFRDSVPHWNFWNTKKLSVCHVELGVSSLGKFGACFVTVGIDHGRHGRQGWEVI